MDDEIELSSWMEISVTGEVGSDGRGGHGRAGTDL